jgi:hypothetical protein
MKTTKELTLHRETLEDLRVKTDSKAGAAGMDYPGGGGPSTG